MKCPAIHVLNPSGKDPYQEFFTKRDLADPPEHPPINFHAYAAATNGCFARTTDDLVGKDGVVLVLLRRRMGRAVKAIKDLKKKEYTVWISFKETGYHQIKSAMSRMGNSSRLAKCVQMADAIVTPSPAARDFFEKHGGDTPRLDLPTPYPTDHKAWSLKPKHGNRGSGIMVGTREFDVPSRNHMQAVRIAAETARATGCTLTVVNPKGKKFQSKLDEAIGSLPESQLTIIENRMPYPEYLKLVAKHRLVFQLDTSGVPGQVAGDCLLTNRLCVGGNGEIESRAYPDFAITGTDPKERDWVALLEQLLSDDKLYDKAKEKSRTIAASTLSFSAFRKSISAIFNS